MRGSRPRLVRVHDKLVPVLTPQHLVGRPYDRVGELRIETAGLFVCERGGLLDLHDRVDE